MVILSLVTTVPPFFTCTKVAAGVALVTVTVLVVTLLSQVAVTVTESVVAALVMVSTPLSLMVTPVLPVMLH